MAVLLLGTALVDVAAACWVLRRDRAVARTSLVVLLASAALWCAAYSMELATVVRSSREAWGDLKYLGTSVLPAAWLMFVLEYTGRRPLRLRRMLVALAVEPLVLFAVLIVPATHDLIRSLPPGPVPPIPVARLGSAYWVHFAYTTLLAAAATVLLVGRLLRVSRRYLRQTVVLAVSAAVPLIANVAANVGLPFARQYDPTPIAASLGGLVLVWGAFRYRLLDLRPVARTLIFDRLVDPVLVVDAYGRIVDRNPAAARRFGAGTAIGAAVQDLLQDQVSLLDATPAGAEIRVGEGDTVRDYELVASAFPDRTGQVSGQLLHLRDITARKQAEGRLRHLAEYDHLTQLPNRQLFADRLAQAVARARRSGSRCALLLLDLDRFKLINDSLGHETGDRVLAGVAGRLKAGRRDEDTAARLGGDEFAVLLPEIGSAHDAVLVAGRILASLALPLQLGDRELIVTASIGVAVWPDDASELRQLYACADDALYRAKGHGHNRVETCAVLGQGRAGERLALGAELWHALRRDELSLAFQPLAHLSDGAVAGMEALLRWQHPRLGLLAPNDFLAVAEDAGLTTQIDHWVLSRACEVAGRWAGDGRTVPVSVNICARWFQDTSLSLSAEVGSVLERTALPPELLIIEISERTVIDDPEPLAGELHDLRRLGVGLALDDFGAGHTSLTHLRRLPLELLKIDRSLVRGAVDDTADLRILTAVTTLAQILGLTVVAEGVEHPEQVVMLEQLGCTVGQGLLLGAPLDADAAVELVKGRVAAFFP